MIKVMCFESQDLFLFIYEEANKSEGICIMKKFVLQMGFQRRGHTVPWVR